MRVKIKTHIFKYKLGGIIMKLRKYVSLSLSIAMASFCITSITPTPAKNVDPFESEITLLEFEEFSLLSTPSLCLYSDQDPRVDK